MTAVREVDFVLPTAMQRGKADGDGRVNEDWSRGIRETRSGHMTYPPSDCGQPRIRTGEMSAN
jgi:hypothetical protein